MKMLHKCFPMDKLWQITTLRSYIYLKQNKMTWLLCYLGWVLISPKSCYHFCELEIKPFPISLGLLQELNEILYIKDVTNSYAYPRYYRWREEAEREGKGFVAGHTSWWNCPGLLIPSPGPIHNTMQPFSQVVLSNYCLGKQTSHTSQEFCPRENIFVKVHFALQTAHPFFAGHSSLICTSPV